MNDVELRRALDRRRQVEHLVQLPRPHRRVVPVAARVGGCEARGGGAVAGGKQRDVVAAPHEPLGEQPRDELDGSGAGRRERRGDGGDLGDAERPHTRCSRSSVDEHASCLEVLLSDLRGPGRVVRVVGVDARHGLDGFVRRRERQQAFARRQVTRPGRVLHDRRAPGREIAFGPIAEPAAPRRHVGVLGDAELAMRRLDEVAIALGRPRDLHRRERRPAVRLEQLLGTVDRQLEARARSRRQVDEAKELDVLVAADVREALDRPAHDGREAVALRCGVGAPQRGHHRLPGLLPRELAGRHRAAVGADVRAEREEPIEAAEEVDVPLFVLRDGELRERRVGIDEHAARDASRTRRARTTCRPRD